MEMRLRQILVSALLLFTGIEGLKTHVIEGMDAKHGNQPWMVSLQDIKGHLCGGSIIRVPCMDNKNQSNIILTAAHCLWKSRVLNGTFVKQCGNTDKNWPLSIVLAGKTDLSKEEAGQTRRSVNWAACHHNSVFGIHVDDIALVRLSEPLEFSETIQPLELSKSMELPPAGSKCRLNGWGYVKPEDHVAKAWHNLPKILQEVDIKLSPECVQETKMCAIRTMAAKKFTKATACGGDSGSPLICQVGEQFAQYGLVSHGDREEKLCQGKFWATRVAAYDKWIQEQIEKLSCNESA